LIRAKSTHSHRMPTHPSPHNAGAASEANRHKAFRTALRGPLFHIVAYRAHTAPGSLKWRLWFYFPIFGLWI
jgi:hypothetical protein